MQIKEERLLNYKTITIIGLRLLSIYIIIQFLIQFLSLTGYYIIPFFFNDLNNQIELINSLFYLIPVIILLLSAIILWIYSKKIANCVVPKDNDQHPNELIDNSEIKVESNFNINLLQSIVFSIVGLIIIVLTIPEITTVIVRLLQYNEIGVEYATDRYTMDTYLLLIENVIKLILGIGLFFGGKGLAGLLNKIRSWG